MEITRDPSSAEYQIRSCSADGVRVNDLLLRESFLLLPDLAPRPWPVQDLGALTLDSLAEALAAEPELIVFGSGARLCFPPAEVQGRLLERGIGVETMTTAAACRTYNLLAHDGRRAAAGLILPA